MTASTAVNRVGKYLYNHLDGAFDFNRSANTFDVLVTLLYQYEGETDIREMTLNFSVTTYMNKIRVNIIELDPKNRTLGFDLYETDAAEDMRPLAHKIFQKGLKRVAKVYGDHCQFLI